MVLNPNVPLGWNKDWREDGKTHGLPFFFPPAGSEEMVLRHAKLTFCSVVTLSPNTFLCWQKLWWQHRDSKLRVCQSCPWFTFCRHFGCKKIKTGKGIHVVLLQGNNLTSLWSTVVHFFNSMRFIAWWGLTTNWLLTNPQMICLLFSVCISKTSEHWNSYPPSVCRRIRGSEGMKDLNFYCYLQTILSRKQKKGWQWLMGPSDGVKR